MLDTLLFSWSCPFRPSDKLLWFRLMTDSQQLPIGGCLSLIFAHKHPSIYPDHAQENELASWRLLVEQPHPPAPWCDPKHAQCRRYDHEQRKTARMSYELAAERLARDAAEAASAEANAVRTRCPLALPLALHLLNALHFHFFKRRKWRDDLSTGALGCRRPNGKVFRSFLIVVRAGTAATITDWFDQAN
jgi:hypothetical protein